MSTTKKTDASPTPAAAQAQADFDDSIAQNRVIPIVAALDVPEAPSGFVPTDAKTRNRRLRKLDDDLVSEAQDALREAVARGDLKKLIGPHAPDSSRAGALLDRFTRVADLRNSVEALLDYAAEVEQIAASDVVVFLEAENKELAHTAEHQPSVVSKFPALAKFFETRSRLISEGMARSKGDAATPSAMTTEEADARGALPGPGKK